jgi:hypothetical protein
MRLKIINQTNHEIKLYLNKLDTSVSVKGNENYDSDILLMDFNNDYPLFVGIEYPDTAIKYYGFEHPGPGERTGDINWNYIFYIIVHNDRVYIFDENAYLDDKNIEKKQWSFYWSYFDFSDHYRDDRFNCLQILIINDTTKKRIIIFKDNERELNFELDKEEARLIKINKPIFLQGNQYENKDYKYFSIETENLKYPSKDVIRVRNEMQIIRLKELRGTEREELTVWRR